MSQTPYLFVYGTLMSGFKNPATAALKTHAVCLGAATMKGLLYVIDYYPGAIYDPASTTTVHGEIWLMTDQATLWPILDDYETVETDPDQQPGQESYDRAQVEVWHQNTSFRAWTYLYNLPTPGLARIESGRFGGGAAY